jgi:hypothetical protein
MILKIGTRGPQVKEVQRFLGIGDDGIFGKNTKLAVQKWQHNNNLEDDGIVGPLTWDEMGIATTDDVDKVYTTSNNLEIEPYYLPTGEFKPGPTKKEYIFLHHTAGWHNPYNTIDGWGRDNRGSIGTEFVIGGPSIKNDEKIYDGKVLQAFEKENYAWHLGRNGSQYMHTHSVGIEVCNFGWVKENKAWHGMNVHPTQTVELNESFRGYKHWHKYSNSQINSLKDLLLHLAERDNIDIREGLPTLIKQKGEKAFQFNEDAFYGKIKGVWTHTNTREDKFDMFPQQELLDMLVSL